MAELLQRSLDAAPFGTLVLSGERVVLEVSPPAAALLGQSQAELVGRPVFDALHTPLNHRLSALLDLIAWGNESEARTRVMAGDRPLELTASPVTGVEGVATLILIQDVSGRIAIELEQSILAETRAAEARTQEFLAALGHELRNPLAPIMTSLDVMQKRGEGRGELSEVRHHVQHLARVVNDLFDMSRLARGKLELEWAKVETRALVTRALQTVQPLLDERGHSLRVEVPEEGLLVSVDAERLAQALGNLLSNAIRYTEPGGSIVVSAQRRGAQVVISVTDSGHGIEPERVATLFQPFGARARRAGGGLGLGLSLARAIVELASGSLSATSQGLGRGSTFELTLPAIEVSAPQASTWATPSTRGFDVLVIDDNVDGAELLGDLLVLLGHQVRIANTPKRAMKLCTEAMPEVIFSDIDLPEMTGHQLAEKLRAMPGGQQSQLIAVTGFGSLDDTNKSLAAGFNRHLVKPLLVETLERVLAEISAASAR